MGNPSETPAMAKRRAGCHRWCTVPEERGSDVEVSAFKCVVVDGAYPVKKCEDADEDEWHIPMTNAAVAKR
jgi:hypothetical protein